MNEGYATPDEVKEVKLWANIYSKTSLEKLIFY